jgi:hypothetical protein
MMNPKLCPRQTFQSEYEKLSDWEYVTRLILIGIIFIIGHSVIG